MNKKVTLTLIFLLWLFMLAFAVAKLFFGEWFAIQITNQRIIAIGDFIDGHKWVKLGTDILVSLIVAHFYFCATLQTWHLRFKQYLLLLIVCAAINAIYLFNGEWATIINLIVMVALPYFFGAQFKNFVIIFIAHYFGQFILLFVRRQALFLIDTNYATQFIVLLDTYIWLVLYYLHSNLENTGD